MTESSTKAHVQSPLHRLDPLTKFLIVLCISTVAIVFINLFLLLGIIAVCIIMAVVARIPLRQLWGYTKSFTYLIILLVIIQAVFYPFPITFPLLKIPANSPVLANYTLLSLDGVVYGVTLFIRLISLVVASTIFSLTTAPRDFLVAMRRIKMPFELIFMVNIAIRFIPDIKDKASEVMLAQKARGLELEKGSLQQKIRNLLPLLTPLLINYMLMARNSAIAIETRAFRWKKERTYMRSMHLTRTDYAVMAATLGLTIFCGVIFELYSSFFKII